LAYIYINQVSILAFAKRTTDLELLTTSVSKPLNI